MKILIISTFILIFTTIFTGSLRSEIVEEPSTNSFFVKGSLEHEEIRFQIDIIRSLLARHPQIMIQNSYYRRNFLELTQALWNMRQELNLPSLMEDYKQDSEFYLISTKVEESHLSNNLRFRNFDNRLKKARKNLEKRYGDTFFNRAKLEDFFLEMDLKKNFSLGKDLLLLAPLLLDHEGDVFPHRNWQDFDVHLQGLGLEGVFQKYSPSWTDFLKSNWKKNSSSIDPAFKILVDYVDEQIFRRELRSVKDFLAKKTASSSNGQDVGLLSSELSLEKMPSILSVFRNFGEDCVLRSVALFALATGAEVYMIRKSSHEFSQPVAYAFVLNLRVNEKLFPYVLTINGNVDAHQINWILDMIGEIKQVEKVLVSRSPLDFKLVNAKVISDQMLIGSFDLEVGEVIAFEEDWKLIEQETEKYKFRNLDVYYTQEKISQTKWRPVRKLTDQGVSLQRRILDLPYRYSEEIENAPLLERAMLAAQFLQKVSKSARERIQKSLGVTFDQVEVLFKFATFDRQKLINAEDFQSMKREVNFKVTDLLNYDDVYAAETLSRLFQLNVISEEKFLEVGKTIFKALSRRFHQAREMNLDPSQYLDLFQGQIALATGLKDQRKDLVDESMLIRSLIYATKNSHNWLVEKLIDMGAIHVNFTLSNGSTLLQTAVYWGNMDLVTFLVDRGASINKRGAYDKWNALRIAVVSPYNEKNKFQMTKLLLEHEVIKVLSREEFEKIMSLLTHRDVELKELLESYYIRHFKISFWGKCMRFFNLND